MSQAMAILEIEQEGTMLILKPATELHDLDDLDRAEAVDGLLEHMDHSGVTDVFLNLHGIDLLHSEAPGLAVDLWKRVRSHGGSLAIGLI
jgi:hypothetical protein